MVFNMKWELNLHARNSRDECFVVKFTVEEEQAMEGPVRVWEDYALGEPQEQTSLKNPGLVTLCRILSQEGHELFRTAAICRGSGFDVSEGRMLALRRHTEDPYTRPSELDKAFNKSIWKKLLANREMQVAGEAAERTRRACLLAKEAAGRALVSYNNACDKFSYEALQD